MRLELGAAQIELDRALAGFRHEAGGHRIQRVPPTERRGRVHSSTVTVAVIDSRNRVSASNIPEHELKVRWFSGTGAGGQHRNKKMCSVELTHLPTGVTRKSQTRSRETSMKDALGALEAAVRSKKAANSSADTNAIRSAQIGLGMRADKRRTWRFRDDAVTDDITRQSITCSRAMRGEIDALWPKEDRLRV